MPKRSDIFQTLVAQIQHHTSLNTDVSVEESKMLPNSDTGELREVDIVVEGKINNVDVVISFECCRKARTAGSPWVEAMIGKHRKLPTHRLILVSQSGFSKPALLAVEATKHVEAATVDEARDVNWGAYAEHMTKLRFGGFESEPLGMLVSWDDPEGTSPPRPVVDKSTVFRRVSDGIEMNGFELALAHLKDQRVGKEVMNQYYRGGKAHELRTLADEDTFTAQGDVDLAFTWEPDSHQWEIVFPKGSRPVRSLVVKARVHIKDSPLELNFRSFMGNQVAHAVLEKPFKNIKGDLRNEVSVALTRTNDGQPVASISFTTHAANEEKIFFGQFNENLTDQENSD